MPRVKVPSDAAIDAEQVVSVLEGSLGSQYEIKRTAGPDCRVIAGPVKAATVKLYQKREGERFIQVNGSPPSVVTRLLLTILFALPLLYVQLVGCKPVVHDVVRALENSPELRGGPAQAAPEAPAPTPPPAPS